VIIILLDFTTSQGVARNAMQGKAGISVKSVDLLSYLSVMLAWRERAFFCCFDCDECRVCWQIILRFDHYIY
jgi:hypothetical protein